MQKDNDISILIIGYDPYIDVWNHYFDLLNKYWPDRPQTYLASNSASPHYENVNVIPCGEDAEWSKKVYLSLDKIPTNYVVLLLEDFFTTKPVNNKSFNSLVNLIEKNNVDYCKLLNQSKIKGKPFLSKKYLHVLSEKSEYGVSLQPSIWKKSFLKNLVGEGNYNAWVFEFNQVKNKTHCNHDYICLGDDRNILEITHAVVQSKYLRKAVRVFKKQNYSIDTSTRPMMSIRDEFKYDLKRNMSDITPHYLKPLFKKIGKKMNVDFVSDRQLKG